MEVVMLITEDQRTIMIANEREYARNPGFDPLPVIKLFDPLGSGTWLLTDLDPDDPDIASGLCDLGMGFPEQGSIRITELGPCRIDAASGLKTTDFFARAK